MLVRPKPSTISRPVTSVRALTSKLVESADVSKASRLQKMRVMFTGLGCFSRVAFHQAQCSFFESKGVSEAEYKSELMLPFVALELGHGDLVRQRPTRVWGFIRIVVLDPPRAKRGVRRQPPLYPRAQSLDPENFNARDRVEPFSKIIGERPTYTEHEDFFLVRC